VDSLKALDPEWPIREADVEQTFCDFAFVPITDSHRLQRSSSGRTKKLGQVILFASEARADGDIRFWVEVIDAMFRAPTGCD
jgi:hypothetical protein